MAVTPDNRLGDYEITEPLGASGMGEVYRARDTRLGLLLLVMAGVANYVPARRAARIDPLETLHQE